MSRSLVGLLFVLLPLLLPAFGHAASLKSLVPCSAGAHEIRVEDKGTVWRYWNECTVCDLQVLAMNILAFLVATCLVVGALIFANAGFLYVTSSANPGNIGRAHKMFTSALMGIILVLAAYMLIDVAMKTLLNATVGEGNVSGYGPWNEILCEGVDPDNSFHDVPKIGKIHLEPEDLILKELPKLKCNDLKGICASSCADGQTSIPNTNCSGPYTCCVADDSGSTKYGDKCTFSDPAHTQKGTCTTQSACGENYSEKVASCGGFVCCEGSLPQGKGLCSVENMSKYWPAEKVNMASCVCMGESSGQAGNNADTCLPNGPNVSWGLFQINLSNETLNGLDCKSAISSYRDGGYTGSHKECSLKTDQASKDLWAKCTQLASIPDINIAKAIDMQSRYGWDRWTVAKKSCGYVK